MKKTVFLIIFMASQISLLNISYADEKEAVDEITKQVNNKVITEELKKYKMVEKTGTKIEICIQAQMVTQAYLQAGNEEKYKEWHDTQESDCYLAGLSNDQ